MQTFHPKTFSFLKNIAKHNNREWFADHKPTYVEVRDQFGQVLSEIGAGVAKFDPHLTPDNLEKSTKVFRIYRDSRFSKDKTPYKTNLGGHIVAAAGTEVHMPGYYLHIEPGNSFIGGGIWRPERMALNAIRDTLAEDHAPLEKILKAKKFRDAFGELSNDDVLKTIPHGFDIDHPAAHLLRYKSFTAGRKLSQKELMSPDFVKTAIKDFKALSPLITWLYAAIEKQR